MSISKQVALAEEVAATATVVRVPSILRSEPKDITEGPFVGLL